MTLAGNTVTDTPPFSLLPLQRLSPNVWNIIRAGKENDGVLYLLTGA